MSRAFSPPDTLSDDDIRTVADVRRAVWINGLFGLGAGAVTGMVGHLILQTLQKKYIPDAGAGGADAAKKAANTAEAGWIYKCLRPLPPLGKNTFLLSLLGGGALGSFVLSTTAGKNAVHNLHPIFNVGRNEYAGKSPYQIAISKDQQLQNEEDMNIATTQYGEDDELDAAHHRTRSLRRKASMKRRLESGHSLGDTHSNTWPDNSEEEREDVQRDRAMHRAGVWNKRQSDRRNTVRDRIEKGRALSDTHSNTWPSSEESEEEQRDRAMHRAEVWGRRQTNRKRALRDRIEKGRALSDSTGGQWSTEDDNGHGDGK